MTIILDNMLICVTVNLKEGTIFAVEMKKW